MGTPNIIYGDYGDEKVTSSTKIGNLPLGQIMELPDGRTYRHARAGGTALVVGTVLRQGMIADSTMDQDVLLGAAAAAGTVTITLTMGATVTTANYYQDGYLYTNLSAGVGSVYKIASHLYGTGSSALVFNLADNDEVALAAVATSSKAGLRQNEFASCHINPAGTDVFKGIICGIAPVAVAASSYFWCQRKGAAVAKAGSAAIAQGEQVRASSAESGSILMAATGGATDGDIMVDTIGHAMAVGAASTYVLVHLELE